MIRPARAHVGDLFLDRLDVARWDGTRGLARCPSHEDRRPSLAIRRGADGRWLMHDFGGCPTDAILATLGLTWSDLFVVPPRAIRQRRPAPMADGLTTVEADAVARERRAARRIAPYRLAFALADTVREGELLVGTLRRRVSLLGDTEAGWTTAAAAARLAQAVALGAMDFEAELTMANARRRRERC